MPSAVSCRRLRRHRYFRPTNRGGLDSASPTIRTTTRTCRRGRATRQARDTPLQSSLAASQVVVQRAVIDMSDSLQLRSSTKRRRLKMRHRHWSGKGREERTRRRRARRARRKTRTRRQDVTLSTSRNSRPSRQDHQQQQRRRRRAGCQHYRGSWRGYRETSTGKASGRWSGRVSPHGAVCFSVSLRKGTPTAESRPLMPFEPLYSALRPIPEGARAGELPRAHRLDNLAGLAADSKSTRDGLLPDLLREPRNCLRPLLRT